MAARILLVRIGTKETFMISVKMIQRIASAAAIVAFAALPAMAARGTADFTRYVALGDSITAGYTSRSLVLSHQFFSYPAIIARQAGVSDFQQPLVSQPGIPAELALFGLSPLVIAPKSTATGSPINLALPRPYNNLAVVGATAHDLLTLTGAEPRTNTATTFAPFVLRGLGTQIQQAGALHATFITLDIGNNDVLGAVLDGTPNSLTPLASFTADYNAILDQIVQVAPSAGVVVGTIPDVSFLPYATTVPPVLVNPATSLPVLGPDGRPIFFVADLGGGVFGQLTPGSRVLLTAIPFLSTGYGIPGALAPLFPSLPDVGKPLPDAVVLTPAEIGVIQERVDQVNGVIRSAAASHDMPVADLQALLSRIVGGVNYGGIVLSGKFITGGLFGYDGFHPSDIGYTIGANEFIKTINRNYHTRIPTASLTTVMANNDNVSGADLYYDGMPFDFTLTSLTNFMDLMQDQPVDPAPAPHRSRTVRH
jgi:hypothetical protein